jgi:chromosome partitioning protein
MIITVASYKGGVGKTTTAVHLAAYLQTLAPTLLLDGDPTRNAMAWAQRGESTEKRFPFRVASIEQAARLARDFNHIVIDTGQRPTSDDLKAAVDGCDLLIVPTVPAALDTDGLGQIVRALKLIDPNCFRVLLTGVAPDAALEVHELRELMDEVDAPAFQISVPRLKAYKKAADQGCIVGEVDDKQAARAQAAYDGVGDELWHLLNARTRSFGRSA